MSQQVLDVLKQRFGSAILETHSLFGDDTAVVDPDKWFEIARFLKSDSRTAMNMFVDLTCVDFPDREPRFEVVMHLRSLDRGHRVRLKARVGDAYGESAEIDSITPVWEGANWFEREAFDMFGVVFRGHPKLRRILMYPEFKGHPLRKDYPANKIQPLVEFRDVVEKLPPFGPDEGMSFGRQTHEYHRDDPLMVEARRDQEEVDEKPAKPLAKPKDKAALAEGKR
jgi:NADH-quinone oxidoreductase subunit C